MDGISKPTIVLLPLPIRGHLISTIEMAKQLLGGRWRGTFSITVLNLRPFLSSLDMPAYTDAVAASGLDIRFEELPFPDGVNPASWEDETPEAFISMYVESHGPCVREAVARLSLTGPVAAMVMDFFSTALIDVATELGIPPYIYFASPASMLGLMLYLPTLDVLVPSDFEDAEGSIEVPGLRSPVPPLSMPTPIMRKKGSDYTWFLYHARRFREARGIIVNTFSELEPAILRAHEEGRFLPDHRPAPPVYPVGPNIALGLGAGPNHECLRWLDRQPRASVVFLCFGSEGSFGPAQVKETAMGLERSGHRFLWVLRSPPSHGEMLSTDTGNLEEVLPQGFLERTRGRGLVWPSWAPQVDVLAHPSVGGFVTHCGWNSSLESLWFGVPMLAWPLYAEQHFNAFQMAGELGVAVPLKADRKNENFVRAEEVERGVRCLMEEGFCEEGRKARARAGEMKAASRRAVEEGGSSFESLERLADELLGGVAGAVGVN